MLPIQSFSILNYIKNNIKLVISIIITLLIILGLIVLSYNLYTKLGEQSHTLQMTTDQLSNTTEMARSLKISPIEAIKVQREIHDIQSSNTPPAITYTVEAPTIESAANTVEHQIRTNDPSAPSEVTKKSDRTIITPNTEKQKVDVYKINLNKAHKIKAGLTYVDNKGYPSVGYQAGKIEGILHMDSRLPTRIKGGSIMYTVAEW